jgi:hypothetical protein
MNQGALLKKRPLDPRKTFDYVQRFEPLLTKKEKPRAVQKRGDSVPPEEFFLNLKKRIL